MKPARGKTPRKTPKRPQTQTDPVQVFCRVRPPESTEVPSCVKVVSSKVLQLTPPEDSHAARNGTIKETQYTFEHVFDEYASQKAVFEHVALPLVEDVLHGKNALLFAYGVTSSGKTHTMTGSLQDQGILPRCLDVIFNSIGELQAKKYVFLPDKMNGYDVQTEADAMAERQRRDILPKLMNTPKTPSKNGGKEEKLDLTSRVRDQSKVNDVEEDNNYAVFVSYVEIYNNVIYDLLEELPYDPITGYKAPQKKDLREDSMHNMYVSGCVEVEIKSTEEAYELLAKGQKRRKVAHTALNAESSRSHSVFNIRVVQAPLDPLGEEVFQDKEKVVVSQLSLVDLAGSERTNRTGNYGERLKEAGSINQVLMVLRGCIEALRENQKTAQNKHIPYRDSRLTNLFRNSFEGQGKVRMIVCCNPKATEYDETVHVMRFAELTQEVQVVRQQQVRFDIGLTPGRRRMNQQYKEALAKLTEGESSSTKTDGNPAGVPLPPPMVYTMGPGFPLLTLTDPSDDSTLATLADYLREREVRRQTLLADLAKKQDAFRQQLLDIERDNIELRQRNEDLEARLTSKESEVKKLERKLQSVEQQNAILQKTANQYEREQRDLHYELGEKELRIHQEKEVKERMRNDYVAKLALSQRQLSEKLEKEKAKLQQKNEAKLRSKQQKLELLANIINNGNDTDTSSMVSDLPTPRETSRFRSRTVGLVPAKSEPDLANNRPTPTAKPPHLRSGTTTGTRVAYKPRHRSPPPVKPKPVVNPRYHRRSKSSGDIWLDHKPAGTINTGTLSQPCMEKKKQVSKVTTKNVKLTNKYCLTHQEVDSEGEVATKLIKGTVVPSATGGSNVVFSDVEIVKQRSPGDRKRRSPALRPEDFEGEWTDTDDRCRVALEGHGLGKRIKHSVV